MSDGNYNRPRRQFEPRVYDERSRDFGAKSSRGPQPGAPGEHDPGADPLEELARVMGQTDPFASAKVRGNESGRYGEPQERAASVLPLPRGYEPSGDEAASARYERDLARRDPHAGLPHMEPHSTYSDPDHSAPRYVAEHSDFSEPSGHDEYPVAPHQGCLLYTSPSPRDS